MAMQDKKLMLNSIENQLKDILTVSNMNKVLQLVAEELDSYEVEQHATPKPANDDDLFNAFYSAKRMEGRSHKTLDRYKYILNRIFEHSQTSTRNITVYHIRQFFLDEKERGMSDRTLEGVRAVVCSYFNWLQREGLVNNNPTTNLGQIRCMKKVKPILTTVDIEKLKEACSTVRNKTILCFLLSTGCRISEVTNVNIEDVDLVKMRCRVLGKGNKERIVYIDDITAMLLKRYLSTRVDDSNALFIGKGSSRLKPGGVRLMLNHLAEKAGVEHVHPHRFRRTLATNLLNRGMAIQEVARILGHDKLDTTMSYVYIEEENVNNHYRQCA